MNFRYKKSYLKSFDNLSSAEKELVIASDKEIRNYYTHRNAPYGLRIKKLYSDKESKIFEARVSDKIRVLWAESKDIVSFVLLGNHDEIKRDLKGLR